MLHIETCSLKDYDKVIKFLVKNDIKIIYRNKMKMVIDAEISTDKVKIMKKEIDFETEILAGEIPFD